MLFKDIYFISIHHINFRFFLYFYEIAFCQFAIKRISGFDWIAE